MMATPRFYLTAIMEWPMNNVTMLKHIIVITEMPNYHCLYFTRYVSINYSMCISLSLYCTQCSIIKYTCVHNRVLCSFSALSTEVLVTIIVLLIIPVVIAVILCIWHKCKTKKGTLKYCECVCKQVS